MNPRYTKHISEAYSQHSEKYVLILEPVLAPMAAEIARLADLRRGEWALDLATGTGLIARVLARFTDTVVGVDLSPGILRIAHEQLVGKLQLILGDGHQLPFGDEAFDVLTCGVSLSHFADIETALKEFRRVMRPGGRFIASAWGNKGESSAKSAAVKVREKILVDWETTFEGPFGEGLWADTQRGCEILQKVGFVEVQVKSSWLTGEYKSHDEAIETAMAWPVTRYRIAQLADADKRRLWEETENLIRQLDDLRWQVEVHYYQAKR